MPAIYPPLAVGEVRTGSGPVLDPEHPTFAADGTGVADSTGALQAALTAAATTNRAVHLRAGRVFSCGNIDVPAGVTVLSDNAQIVRRTFGGASTALIDMAAGSRLVGHLRIDGDSGNVTGVGGTDSHYAVQVNGDNVFVDSLEVEGFGTGFCYHLQVTGADYFRLGSLVSRDASYASLRITSATTKRNLCQIGSVVSIDAAFKGLVYNGTGGFGTVWVDRLWATTDSTNDATENLLFDSGDADAAATDTSTTVRVDRLHVGTFYGVGARSNAIKIEHVGHFSLGDAFCQPSTAFASRAAIRAHCPRTEIKSVEASERIICYGDLRVGSLDYVGSGDRALELNGLLGEQAWIGRLRIGRSTISSAPIRVSRGTNRLVHLESYDSTSQQPLAYTSPLPTNQISFSVGPGVLVAQTNSGITNSTDNDRVHRPPRQVRRTAAPSAGTWVRNDICWNTTPSAAGYVGWVCVTAGTPGTWKGFGEIEP